MKRKQSQEIITPHILYITHFNSSEQLPTFKYFSIKWSTSVNWIAFLRTVSLNRVVKAIPQLGIVDVCSVVDVHWIGFCEISSPSERGIWSDLSNKAPDATWLVRTTKTRAVAKFTSLSVDEVHVNGVTNEMIASFGGWDDGASHKCVLSVRTCYVNLEIVLKILIILSIQRTSIQWGQNVWVHSTLIRVI